MARSINSHTESSAKWNIFECATVSSLPMTSPDMAHPVSAVALLGSIVLLSTVVSVDPNEARPKNEVTETEDGTFKPVAVVYSAKLDGTDDVITALPITVTGKAKRQFLNRGWISKDRIRTFRPVYRIRPLSGKAQIDRTSFNRFSYASRPVYRFRPLSRIAQIHRTSFNRFMNIKNFNFYKKFKNKSKNRKKPKAKQSKKPKPEDDNTEHNNTNQGKSTTVNSVANTIEELVTTASVVDLTTPVTTTEETKVVDVKPTPEVNDEVTSNSPNEESSSARYKVLADDVQTATSNSPTEEVSSSLYKALAEDVQTATSVSPTEKVSTKI